jgi:outer membrane protein TolC
MYHKTSIYISRIALFVVCVFLLEITVHGQTELSLLQAQDYAIKNSFTMKNTIYDAEVASKNTQELIATGLPQIDGSASFQHNIYAPYSIIPAGSFGPNEQRIRFQQPYNLTMGITATQLLFSGTWLVGLEASKAYELLQQSNIDKTEQQIKDQVSDLYYLAIVSGKNVAVLEESRTSLDKTLTETTALFQAGFAEQQDVDQINLALSELAIQISYARDQQSNALRMLKFFIGMPIADELRLSDTVEGLMSTDANSLLLATFDPTLNVDIQLVQRGLTMQHLNVKSKKAAYMPSLAGFFTVQTQAQRDKVNFFDSKQPYLYGNFWGLSLNVPILSGGQRKYATQKASVEVKRLESQLDFMKQQTQLTYESARIELNNANQLFTLSKQSMDLAQQLYDKENLKYKEGVGSSFELTTRNTNLIVAKGNYIQAMLRLLQSKNKLAKALGQY